MDWNNPLITQTHVNIFADLKSRDVDAITLAESPTNPPTGAIKYLRASNKFQEWNGSAWVDKVISIEGGGTGGASAAAARTALGIGSLGIQNSNAASISGGSIAGLTALGVSGNATISGQIIAGSTPTTITDSAGKILETAIADGAILARIAANETIAGTWTFNNTIAGNAATVSDGVYLSTSQQITGRKSFTAAQTGSLATITQNLGGIELYSDGAGAAFMSFHRPGNFAVYFGLDGSDLKVGGFSMGAVAHTIIHAGNIASYSPGLTGSGASGSWGINATTASVLQTARNINGVSFNGSADITVTAAAGTLSGATLAASVTASSLTSFGANATLRLADGVAGSPSLGFSSIFAVDSGIYHSGSGTIEFGAAFGSGTRGVMRAYPSSKVDFLIGADVELTLETNQITLGDGTNLRTNGHISSLSAGAYNIGSAGNRFANIYLVNSPNVSSDIRTKNVKGDINDALEMVMSINPFIFDWKDSQDRWDRPGFSAQEVEQFIDARLGTRIVNTDILDIKSMYADNLVPILWQAVKDLTLEIRGGKN